jgi:hypothetical protein
MRKVLPASIGKNLSLGVIAMFLSAAAVFGFATSCQIAAFGQVLITPAMIQKIAEVESGFDTEAVRVNHKPGKADTWDVGLMQINTGNFSRLGLDMTTAKDKCRSIEAGVRVLLSRYNTGKSDSDVGIAYARRVINAPVTPASPPVTTEGEPPSWDLEAVAEWRRIHIPTPEDALTEK